MRLSTNRCLYNADCNTIFYTPELWQPQGGRFSSKAVHRFVETLADGGVDTLLINPNAQVAWYPSRMMPTQLDGYKRGDREFVRGHAPNNPDRPQDVEASVSQMTGLLDLYLDLVEDGVDWVAEMITACRRHQITPWVSVRMNDTHGAAAPAASFFNCPLYKNPKYRLSGRLPNPKDGPFVWWLGLNYDFPEVRDYFLRQIRELVNDYDFEGIELDWTRHFPIFEMPATATQTDTITEWIGEVRAIAQARSRRTGRRYPLGVRTLCDFDKSRSLGVDVRTLAREERIDFVVAASFWHTTWDIPIDRLRAELNADITLYGASDAIANWLRISSSIHPAVQSPRYMASSAPLLRGCAAGQLALGADGIEQFNFFAADCDARSHREAGRAREAAAVRADYRGLRGLGRIEELRGTTKHYTFSTLPTDWWVPPHLELPEPLPALIEFGSRRAFRLSMAREPVDCGLGMTLQIVIEKTGTQPDLGVSFNGSWPRFDATRTDEVVVPVGPFERFPPGHLACTFYFTVNHIKEGWNEIVVYHGNHDSMRSRVRRETVRIVSIEIAIRP